MNHKLTDAQIAEYHDKGYVVPNLRLPDAQLQEIRDRHSALLQRHPELRDNASALLSYDLGFLNYADAKSGQIIVLALVHTRHFSSFTTNERCASLFTAYANACNNSSSYINIKLSRCIIVKEEKWFSTADNQIIDTHGN